MVFDPTGKENLLMTEASCINRFIHAGKGELTLVAPSLNAHTYRFLSPSRPEEFEPNTIFAFVLHDGHKYYLGRLTNQGVVHTRNSSFSPECDSFKGAQYIAYMAASQSLVDKTPMKIYQSGRCCMCGRELVSGKTLKLGIGPKCAKRWEEISSRTSWDGN